MSRCMGDLGPGCRGRVVGFGRGDRGFRKKLLAMGVTAGTEFHIERVAPLGDPVEIRLRGFSLSLRRGEAAIVLVEAL